MPPLPLAPGVLRVFLDYEFGTGNLARNRFYVSYTGSAPSDPTCQTLASDITTAWGAHLASLMSDNDALKIVDVTDLTSDTAGTGASAGTTLGTRSGTDLPNDTCIVLNKNIARRYRGGRPRCYLPYGMEGDLSANPNIWSSTFQTAVLSGWEAFMTAVQALSVSGTALASEVNVSSYSGFASSQNPISKRWRNIPTPRSGDAVVDTIVGYSVRAEIGIQKRRRISSTY